MQIEIILSIPDCWCTRHQLLLGCQISADNRCSWQQKSVYCITSTAWPKAARLLAFFGNHITSAALQTQRMSDGQRERESEQRTFIPCISILMLVVCVGVLQQIALAKYYTCRVWAKWKLSAGRLDNCSSTLFWLKASTIWKVHNIVHTLTHTHTKKIKFQAYFQVEFLGALMKLHLIMGSSQRNLTNLLCSEPCLRVDCLQCALNVETEV